MYQIFKNVLFTKGYNRTLIYDTLTSSIHFIPNDMYELILNKNFIFDDNFIVKELLDFFIKNRLVFETEKKILDLFPDLNYDIDIPNKIITAVLDLSFLTAANLYKFNVERINCSIAQFNFILSEYSCKDTLNFLNDFANHNEADAFEFTVLNGFKNTSHLFKILESVNKIITINNYSDINLDIYPTMKSNRFFNPLDEISLRLSLNHLTYFESKDYHLYFNRKLFIGKNTEIKNVFESNESFGYLEEMNVLNLEEIILDKDFNKFWNVKKEDTLVCSICEFRRLCIDNRIPIKINEKWIHNKECDYNPFISKWKFEQFFLNLNECGVSIKNDEILLDEVRLKMINKNLWEL
jgi:hypothetical protein